MGSYAEYSNFYGFPVSEEVVTQLDMLCDAINKERYGNNTTWFVPIH